jgi:O-antigen biosynthesis protein
VAQVFASDDLHTELVFVASPSVLQFPASEPCRITAEQVVIRAGRAPAGPDGKDFYYTPRDCQMVAKKTFSADPRWSARSPAIRAHIEAELPPSALLPFDLAGTVDVARFRVDRTRARSHLPVVGTHFTDSRAALPADRDALLQIYPDSPEVDVRLMGWTRTLLPALQPDRVPVNWLVYDFDEVGVRSFLGQIDFYVYFPPPSAPEAFSRPVLEALASGCVVVAPHRMSAAFDGAALYRDPSQVLETVRDLHSDRETYQEQSRRAREWIRQNFNEETYVSLVNDLLG